ncbi:glycosyltransferase [Singulisphaera sp. Ch08]|uniref:Glycosyltransferase n=1 Tax=Singulisphaera sp. Ch08 TaxID=3120278 RepID=A0AAU7CFQ8_9BACT
MGTETLISVVAVVQNDGPLIAPFVAEVLETLRGHWINYEIVLVDDYSTDDTLSVVERLLSSYPCLRLIRLTRRFGAEVAVTAGLDAAIGDYVAVMRPLSDPPDELPAMVDAAERDGNGVVLGVSDREPGRGRLSHFARHAFYFLMRRLLHHAPPVNATGFCVLSRTAVNAITRTKSQYRHLGFLSCTVGHAVTLYDYRQIARSSKRYVRPLREAVDEAIAVLITQSPFPLRAVSYLGAFAGLMNLIYVLYILLVNVVKRQVAEGWTTLSLQISFMFFFAFLNLMIISEYVARMMQETQERPLYHVLDERCSTVKFPDPARRNVS